MGRVAVVLDSTRVTEQTGENVTDITLDPDGGNNVTAQLYSPPGEDALPLDGDFAVYEEGDSPELDAVVGFHDPKLAPFAEKGEKVIFSRSGPGVVAASVHLKKDGSVALKNSGVTITAKSDGTVSIDASSVTITGDLKVNGEVTAHAATVPVTLTQHVHPTGVGPSGPPQG